MSMLRRIRVQRYKSIVDVTLELGSVNVLCGESCAGKTNLLEAVALLGAAASGSLRHLQSRGIRLWSEHGCALCDIPRRPIELEAASDRVCYRVKLEEDSRLVYLAEAIEFDGSVVLTREEERGWITLRGGRQDLRTSPDVGIAPVLRCVEGKGAAADFLRRLDELAIIRANDVIKDDSWSADLWNLASGELANLVPAVATGASPDHLLLGARPRLRDPNRRQGEWVELDQVGQGAASMLGVFLALLSKTAPRVLVIDGPDPSLPPDVAAAFAARVATLTRERERQLLWIANKAEALNAMRGDGPRVFCVRRDPKGASVIDAPSGSRRAGVVEDGNGTQSALL